MDLLPEQVSQSELRRHVKKNMIIGGLAGWGIIACVVAGALSPPGSPWETAWFIAATVMLCISGGFMIRGYRVEIKYNPNYDPKELATREEHGTPATPQLTLPAETK